MNSSLYGGPAAHPAAPRVDRPAHVAVALALLAVVAGLDTPAAADLAAADRAWAARASATDDGPATMSAIEPAIAAYRSAIAARPRDLEARWKLLRSLHYLAEFTNAPDDRKQDAVDEAVALARTAVDRLDRDAGDPEDRAQLYFWSAIAWGARAQRVGLLTIVREGVANRMHDCAQTAAALSPAIERGGAFRLLSRLHGTLPRVPFISGWVDPEQTLPLAEKAYEIAPSDPGNQVILALALLEHAPARRAQALELLASAARLTPRAELLAEDRAIREEARRTLDEIRQESEQPK